MPFQAIISSDPPTTQTGPKKLWSPELFNINTGSYGGSIPSTITYPSVSNHQQFYEGAEMVSYRFWPTDDSYGYTASQAYSTADKALVDLTDASTAAGATAEWTVDAPAIPSYLNAPDNITEVPIIYSFTGTGGSTPVPLTLKMFLSYSEGHAEKTFHPGSMEGGTATANLDGEIRLETATNYSNALYNSSPESINWGGGLLATSPYTGDHLFTQDQGNINPNTFAVRLTLTAKAINRQVSATEDFSGVVNVHLKLYALCLEST